MQDLLVRSEVLQELGALEGVYTLRIFLIEQALEALYTLHAFTLHPLLHEVAELGYHTSTFAVDSAADLYSRSTGQHGLHHRIRRMHTARHSVIHAAHSS